MKKTLFLMLWSTLFSSETIKAQCNAIFSDGFESGSYSPAWVTSLPDFSVTAGAAAVGNYKIVSTGSSAHLNGISSTFPASTPSEVSWYIYPQGTAFATNYVVLGNNSSTATDCMVFAHWYNSPMGIRMLGSGAATFQYPATTGQWYFIELKNINYVARTFDIYINGALQQTAFPFRSSTLSNITKVHLYNVFQSTATWDEIKIGSGMLLSGNTSSVSCFGATTGASTITTSGVTGPYTYTWTGSASTSSVATNLSAGMYTVSVTANGTCTATQTINVTQPASLTASSTKTNVTCTTPGRASLGVSGATPPYSFSWTPSGGSFSIANNLAAGTYTCIITDMNSCVNTHTVAIGSNTTSPVLNSTLSNSVICIGQTASMGVTGADTYSWSTGATTSSITVSPTVTTSYSVTGTSTSNGCTTTLPLSLTVSQCTGIETLSGTNAVHIYPNPGRGIFYVELEQASQVIVCNMLGDVILEAQLRNGVQMIDINGYSDGVYFIKIVNANAQQSASIVKY